MKSPTLFSKTIVANDATAAAPTITAQANVGRHSGREAFGSVSRGPLSAGWYSDMISCVLGMNQATISAAAAIAATSLDGKFEPARSAGTGSASRPNMLLATPSAVPSVGARKNTHATVTSRNVRRRPAQTDNAL